MLSAESLHLVRRLVWDSGSLFVSRPGPNCVATIRSGLIRIFLTSGLGFFISTLCLVFHRICINQPLFEVHAKLMIQAYVGDGSGFHTQVAIYEQGYSNSFTFALALYQDGTAAGYLCYPYTVITGHSGSGSAAEINTP